MRISVLILALLLSTSGTRLTAAERFIDGVTARASSEQVKGLMSAMNLVNDHGFKETSPGSGVFQLTTNGYADGGSMWNGAYLAIGPDEHPLVEFDLGKVQTVGAFRVWNHNGSPHRGFEDVTIQYSASDEGNAESEPKSWRTIRQRFRFAKAPKADDYTGELQRFESPIVARRIRFFCNGTHRSGGQSDVAGLGKVRFIASKTAAPTTAQRTQAELSAFGSYPDDCGWLNVREAPYSAHGDGQHDDTDAIQRAIDECQATGRVIYLPAGTYLISKTLKFEPGRGHGRNNMRGESPWRTILRLKDSTFTDVAKPQTVLTLGFCGNEEQRRGSADWFNNNVAELTIDTGRGNAGAIGLQFYSNNTGSLRDVTIRSGDGERVIGLDLAYFDMNGPLLVKRLHVEGFDIGIKTGGTVNSQTLEHITLARQRQVGFLNEGQCLAIRGLKSRNAVTAFQSKFGIVALVDAELTGSGMASDLSAIISREALFARNIRATGYKLAIENTADGGTPSVAGPNVAEFVSAPVLSLFPGHTGSLDLPIEETLEPAFDPVADWANVRSHRRVTDSDDTAAFQRALDSGATTVYLPKGSGSHITETITIGPKVHRLAGLFGALRGHTLKDRDAPVLRIEGGTAEPLVIEDCSFALRIENHARRPLVIRNCEANGVLLGEGKAFFENVVGHWEIGPSQQFWARHFNTEEEGVHFLNAGGQAWFLGLKTERGGPLIETRAGGKTEVLGGLSYTTTKGKLGPMFVTEDAALSVTLGEVCYSGDPFRTLARETRQGETKELQRGDAPLRASFLQGSRLPLFASGK